MKPKTIKYYYEGIKEKDLNSISLNHQTLLNEGYYVSDSKSRDRMDISQQPPVVVSKDLNITFELK